MKTLQMLALVAALALAGCGNRSEELRYRMRVEVETPQGLRSNSSVIEVGVNDPGRGLFVLPDVHPITKLRGEAVAVDLPNGKQLFALLSKPGLWDGAEQFPYAALKPKNQIGEYATIREFEELKTKRNAAALPSDSYPALVTFDNLADPATVREVKPDQLAAQFGEGYRLRAITIQITDAPVTFGLVKRVPWLAGMPEEALAKPRGRMGSRLAANLHKGQFRHGD